jgi:hypothetical protein
MEGYSDSFASRSLSSFKASAFLLSLSEVGCLTSAGAPATVTAVNGSITSRGGSGGSRLNRTKLVYTNVESGLM